MNLNVHNPFLVGFVPVNVFIACCVLTANFFIASVLCFCAKPKIRYAVIGSIAIDMIYFASRPLSVCIKPRKTMGRVLFVKNTNKIVPRGVANTTSRLSDSVTAPTDSSSDNPGIGVVVDYGLQNCLVKHDSTPFVALRKDTATSKVLAFGCPLAVMNVV
jgi:hypothetical protein